MKEILLPSDEALRARSAELAADKLKQEKTTWQAKIDELQANIKAIEQQIGALRAQADLGDYRPDSNPTPPTEEWLALDSERRVLDEENWQKWIGRIRQAMAVLALKDNEPTVQHFRKLRPIDPGGYDSWIEWVDGDYVTELLCVQGDSVLYAEERSPDAPGDTVNFIQTMQTLFSPVLGEALGRRDICLRDTGAEGYDNRPRHRHSQGEMLEAIDRARISRLIEWGAVELRKSGTAVTLQLRGKDIPIYQQTYTLDPKTTVVLTAKYDTAQPITGMLDRQLAGEQAVDPIEWFRVERIGAAGTDRGFLSMNKKYLTARGRYGEKGLSLEEVENLITQITEEKV